ncbi:MAG: cytidylate kinase, partial [Cytophagia bacterium]|nr:cytidylate kinase [Cytophagia bacterium]
PDAELKVFMTADILVRAFRRQQELLSSDKMVDLLEVMENIHMRDQIDTTRVESPLRKADDAIEINTTHITIDEQVDAVVQLAIGKMVQSNR